MANDNKAVGPLATAKLVTLIKAETGKKYDKTGGKIEGSAEITGDLQVAGYAECGVLEAQTYVKGDAMVMSPVIMLDDAATDVYLSTDGDGAAKMTTTGADADAPLARLKVATPTGDNDAATKKYVDEGLSKKAGTATATQFTDGLMPATDKAKLDGIEAGATKTTVDAALNVASENPVQNKAVKAALDGKLSTSGGEISGYLEVGQTVSAEGSVSVGRTSSDTGIHFEKAASDAGRISHGSDPMTGVSPIARLKVAAPTEDDDAATKAYVDNNAAGAGAVRYDAVQTLDEAQQFQARKNIGAVGNESPQFKGYVTLTPANAPLGTGVGLSPSGSGNDFTLDISDVNEGTPTLLTGVKTPNDTHTNAAATVEYVKNKISEVAASGGVDVDNALSATSTNPVQNKVVTAALTGKAGTAVATTSANGLMSKADKAKLDGIAAGATQVTIDSAMSGSSNNPVANHVVKQYVDDKVAAAGSNITVDTSLSSTSTNPVQNKAVKAAIDAKADKTALDGKLDKTGGALTGNLTGKYITGTWLQSTAAENLGKTPGKIAVLDDSGWVYYRTPDELLADIGAATVSAMLDKAYPVGSIYMSVNSTNPKTLFGGTWVQLKDRFLLAAGTTYKAGATGGEATHTLTANEMPSHNHAVYTPNDGAADHSAPGNYPDGTSDSTYYAVGSYTSSAGGGGAHNNMPPYLSVYVWKRTA